MLSSTYREPSISYTVAKLTPFAEIDLVDSLVQVQCPSQTRLPTPPLAYQLSQSLVQKKRMHPGLLFPAYHYTNNLDLCSLSGRISSSVDTRDICSEGTQSRPLLPVCSGTAIIIVQSERVRSHQCQTVALLRWPAACPLSCAKRCWTRSLETSRRRIS